MARPAKPWYWTERDGWYITSKGKRILLAKSKGARKEAYRRFLELPDNPSSSMRTARAKGQEVCRLFLEHAKVNLQPTTYDGYKRYLEPFGKTVRSLDGNAVQPKHVTEFLHAHPNWGKTTRFNAITAIKRAWKWALDEGHLTLNDLAGMKRPKPQRRDEIPDDNEIRVFLKAASRELRQVFEFVDETGCRPGEVLIMESRHVHLAFREVRYRIGEDKTSAKTGKPRVIHLNDKALAMLTELTERHPTGPLFRNSQGKAWTRNAITCAVRRIRERTGLDGRMVTYALRHRWATDALATGVPLVVVAELMGNSTEIVSRVYSHLSDKKAMLLEAANLVRPNSQTENSRTPATPADDGCTP